MDNPACYEIGVPSILCTRIRARIDPNLRVSTFVFRTVIPSGRSKMIAVENSKVFEIYCLSKRIYFFFQILLKTITVENSKFWMRIR